MRLCCKSLISAALLGQSLAHLPHNRLQLRVLLLQQRLNLRVVARARVGLVEGRGEALLCLAELAALCLQSLGGGLVGCLLLSLESLVGCLRSLKALLSVAQLRLGVPQLRLNGRELRGRLGGSGGELAGEVSLVILFNALDLVSCIGLRAREGCLRGGTFAFECGSLIR